MAGARTCGKKMTTRPDFSAKESCLEPTSGRGGPGGASVGGASCGFRVVDYVRVPKARPAGGVAAELPVLV